MKPNEISTLRQSPVGLSLEFLLGCWQRRKWGTGRKVEAPGAPSLPSNFLPPKNKAEKRSRAEKSSSPARERFLIFKLWNLDCFSYPLSPPRSNPPPWFLLPEVSLSCFELFGNGLLCFVLLHACLHLWGSFGPCAW